MEAIAPQQAMPEQKSLSVRWDAFLSFVAFAPCIAYYSFAGVTAIYLGHWPYYAHPDPKELPDSFGTAMLVVLFAQVVWVAAFWPILIWASVRMWRAQEFIQFMAAIVPAVLVLLNWVIMRWDPHGVLDWFWD